MRILVDGMNLSLATGTGVATYARNVCQIAKEAGHHVDVLYGEPFQYTSNPVFRDISFFDTPATANKNARSSKARVRKARLSHLSRAKPFQVPLTGTVITKQFAGRLPIADGIWNSPDLFYFADMAFAGRYRWTRRFNRVANVFPSDLAHWTYPMPLRLEDARNIYTIHDLVPLRLPFTTLDKKRSYYRMVERICREADAIVTVSETSRSDILSLFNADPEKVFNTYQSVDIPQKYIDIPEDMLRQEIRGIHNLEYKNYILYYGAVEPKKNVDRLVEAYLSTAIEIPLLVVGKEGWLVGGKDKGSGRSGGPSIPWDNPRLRRIDYVSFPQLVNLIRGARMVAFPSLYEGFGLPILESMICRTPVLTSNFGATAEVAGDAAVLVDPYDTRDIRAGLVKLVDDEELRARLVEEGTQRAGLFSPERHAQKLNAVYETVTGR